MINGKYKLRVLPLFEQDLNRILDYISVHLQNPTAAENLLDEVEKAVYERLECPEVFAPFPSVKKRKYPYYRIRVKNYSVFYVVIDDTMELRRILYSRRDADKLL